jgi:hypothetical protein
VREIVDPGARPLTMANCWHADSICLKLPMQVMARLVLNAYKRFGTAMQSMNPINTTTTMISNNVKPLQVLFVMGDAHARCRPFEPEESWLAMSDENYPDRRFWQVWFYSDLT